MYKGFAVGDISGDIGDIFCWFFIIEKEIPVNPW